MDNIEIRQGDCRKLMAAMEQGVVDAIVTDPPYGLGFMGKEWDTPGTMFERKAEKRNRFDHVGGNHNPINSVDAARTRRVEGGKFQMWSEAWAIEALRVLKPGGHLAAFGGTRTFHRLACAIEEAGFEIRDCLCWLYGQGFPKSLNVGGGLGTALKPAWEPIILARKPLAGTVAANILAHGTGALNVDGCRIGTEEIGQTRETGRRRDRENWRITGGSNGDGATSPLGRWPANLILDEDAARALDEQSERTSGFMRRGQPRAGGGASRFFYTAKASSRERHYAGRNAHPTVKPVSLMRWLVRLVTPPGGLVLDPFMGSGSTGIAALSQGLRFLGIELDAESIDVARKRIAGPLFAWEDQRQ